MSFSKVQWLKKIIFFSSLIYIVAALSIETTTGRQNLFPFYNWRIFHTYPFKHLDRYAIIFYEIDGEKLDPPVGGIDYIQKKFPLIDVYTFDKKVNQLGEWDGNHQKVLNDINKQLTTNYEYIEWGLYRLKVDPIEYFWENKFLSKMRVRKYVSTR